MAFLLFSRDISVFRTPNPSLLPRNAFPHSQLLIPNTTSNFIHSFSFLILLSHSSIFTLTPIPIPMSLTEKSSSPLSLFPFYHSKKKPLKPSSKPFDETLIRRLESLLPIPTSPAPAPTSAIPLSWLSRSADLLALTLNDACAIISDPSLSGSDLNALSSHLDSSVALLDACNAATAEIDRILRSRLHLRLALHHLASVPPRLRRARELISEWDRSPRGGFKASVHLSEAPRGKISVVRRAIYAVEAVSSLVVGSIAAVIGGGETKDLDRIYVSEDSYPWAPAFNKVLEAVKERAKSGVAGEVAAMAVAVRRLTTVIDGEEEEGLVERVAEAVKETEKAMEKMVEGMDRLTAAINGVFTATMSTRNAALRSYRIGPQKCK